MKDQAEIYVQAGDGGPGCNSFQGTRLRRTAHPNGGSGGRGGDVIIRADKNIQSLEQFQFKRNFSAPAGKGGQGNKKKGAQARPFIIKVPAGTIVRDLENNLLLGDLTESGAELLVAKGGAGGEANAKSKPATAGLLGEQKRLALELKLIADIGVVGYPNVGKSSLLVRISSARAKIADYPFTTVSPILGVLTFTDFVEPESLTIVELPGLIKGSHQGKGLGAQFLRHSERAKVLIHLLDMSGPAAVQEGRGPYQDFQDLNQQLKFYNPQLLQKPQVLVANKMDLPGAGENFRNFSQQIKKRVYPISALNGTGIVQLISHLRTCF